MKSCSTAGCVTTADQMTGLSYVEVLVAVALIAVTLVPAMDALLTGLAGSDIHETSAEGHYRLAAKLEQVLAEPFTRLDSAAAEAGNATTPTSYSDVVTLADGRQFTRNVFLSRYDGDNADGDGNPFTGTDQGLLWVQVASVGAAARLESLISDDD